MSKPLITDEEIVELAKSPGGIAALHSLVALVRRRLAERLRECPFHSIRCHAGCNVNRAEAARLVESDDEGSR